MAGFPYHESAESVNGGSVVVFFVRVSLISRTYVQT